jgi:N-acetylmuramoyl-L-alanine amidase CwlA
MTRRQPRKGEITQMTTSIPQEQTKTTPATATTKAHVAKRRTHAAPPKSKPARKGAAAKKLTRRGSKTAKILDLLKRPGGVTLKEIMKATEWQARSVRGFLSGTIGKKMGTTVDSSKRADGERVYRVSSK